MVAGLPYQVSRVQKERKHSLHMCKVVCSSMLFYYHTSRSVVDMDPLIRKALSSLLGEGEEVVRADHLSDLWAGYGHIYRIHIEDASRSRRFTRILKSITPPIPSQDDDPDEGHKRKVLSYRIESNFYRNFSKKLRHEDKGLDDQANVPRMYGSVLVPNGDGNSSGELQVLLLEDLSINFPILTERRGRLDHDQVVKAIGWLAKFHAAFWNVEDHRDLPIQDWCPSPIEAWKDRWMGEGLWQQGGYSYLSTRTSELESIHPEHDEWGALGLHANSELPEALDWWLNQPEDRSRLSLIHGDVKAANMAFSQSKACNLAMAMYDFQYVGKGLGVQDLAKFLTTSIPAHYLAEKGGEEQLLRLYHDELVQSLPQGHRYPFDELMQDWEVALVSWVRFLAGWSGGFWGNVDWLQDRARGLLVNPAWRDKIILRWQGRPGIHTGN